MMKKFFTKSWFKAACVAVLGLMSVNASAIETAVPFSFYNPSQDNERTSQESNGVTIRYYSYNAAWEMYAAANIYQNNSNYNLEVESSSTITKIEMTLNTTGGYTNPGGLSSITAQQGSWDGAGTWTGSENLVVFNAPSKDIYIGSIIVYIEEDIDPSITYTVDLANVEHGSISASATTDVHAGDFITLSATPEAGYSLEAWDVTNNTTSGKVAVTNNTFKMPASDVTVSASFVKYHSITLASVANGTIYASKDNLIKAGEEITLAATPAAGYIFDSWNVTNDETSEAISVVNNQFTMPDANVTVSAVFDVKPVPVDNYSNSIATQDLFDEFTIIDNNGDGIKWYYENNYYTGGTAKISYNSYAAMNDYLVSPAVIVTGGTYRLSANIKEESTTYQERFELVYGTEPTAAALTNVIVDPTTPTTSYNVYSGEFTILTPGTYYFAVHGISDADKYFLYAKDFELVQLSGLSTSPAVNIASVENGSIVAKVNGTPITSGDEIETGTVVTLEATPDAKYEFVSWNVTGATVADASAATTTFTVGNEVVNISATFDLKGKVNATTQFYFPDFTAHTIAADEVLESNPTGVTLTFSSVTADTRIYSYGSIFSLSLCLDGNFTIAAPANGHVKEVRFFGSSTSYPGYSFWENNDVETDGSYQNLTWTATTPVNSVTFVGSQYRVGKIEVDFDYVDASANVTVTAAGYTSYYNSAKAYTMPAGLTGYVVTPALQLAAEYEAGDVVPAGEPLVLQGAAGEYELEYAESSEWPLKSSLENLLDGTDTEQTTPVSLYAFYNGGSDAANCYFFGLTLNAASDLNSAGFYYMNATGAAFTNGAHKAYLCLPKTMLDGVAAGQFRGWSFEEMENGLETAISLTPSLSEGEGACYDLYGRRTNGKGVMLQNGKVVLVK